MTPPVGLASFAAAAIARTDPLKTGVTAFIYSMRTAILPFLFIFNTQLLLMGIDSVWHLALTVSSAVLAMLVFAAATQGYFLVKSRLWESAALLLVTFSLFRPGFWWDMVYPPYEELNGPALAQAVKDAPANTSLRFWVEGLSLDGNEVKKGVLVPLGEPGDVRTRLGHSGMTVMPQGQQWSVMQVKFGSTAEKLGLEQGFAITAVEVESHRPDKEWVFIPALLLLALVVISQRRRSSHTK